MKKLNFAFAGVVMVMAFGQQAMAADGTITFNGEVTDVTCSLSAEGGGSGDAAVTLPTVGMNALSVAGTTAGATPFTISLSGCTSATSVEGKKVAVYFEPGANINVDGRLTNKATNNPASEVEIALYLASDDTTPLPLGVNPLVEYSTIASQEAKMDFLAKYYATGTATAGMVTSSVTYSIVYP